MPARAPGAILSSDLENQSDPALSYVSPLELTELTKENRAGQPFRCIRLSSSLYNRTRGYWLHRIACKLIVA